MWKVTVAYQTSSLPAFPISVPVGERPSHSFKKSETNS